MSQSSQCLEKYFFDQMRLSVKVSPPFLVKFCSISRPPQKAVMFITLGLSFDMLWPSLVPFVTRGVYFDQKIDGRKNKT